MFYVIIATLCRRRTMYTTTTYPKAYPKAITIPYIDCTFTI